MLCGRHELEMSKFNAGPIAAVVQVMSLGDRAVLLLPGEAVGANRLDAGGEHTIAPRRLAPVQTSSSRLVLARKRAGIRLPAKNRPSSLPEALGRHAHDPGELTVLLETCQELRLPAPTLPP